MAESPVACICMADGVGCREVAQEDDVLCRSCRLHHERPFGPNMPRHPLRAEGLSHCCFSGCRNVTCASCITTYCATQFHVCPKPAKTSEVREATQARDGA